MTVNVNTTLDLTDIWQGMNVTEQKKFFLEISSDIDSSLLIEELESRGLTIKVEED